MKKDIFLYILFLSLYSFLSLPEVFSLKGLIGSSIEDNAAIENILTDLKTKKELKDVGGIESVELFEKYRTILNEKGIVRDIGNIFSNQILVHMRSLLYIDEKEELVDLQKKWMEKVGKTKEALIASKKVRELYDQLYVEYVNNILDYVVNKTDTNFLQNDFETVIIEAVGTYKDISRLDTLFYFFHKETTLIDTLLLAHAKKQIKEKMFLLVEPYLEESNLYFTIIYVPENIALSSIGKYGGSVRENFLHILNKETSKKIFETYIKAMTQKYAIFSKEPLKISPENPIDSYNPDIHWFF